MRFPDELDARDLHALLQSVSDLTLIDVRTHGEIAGGVIPGARHIPLHLPPLRLNELPKAGAIVFYCRSGARSAHARSFVAAHGRTEIVNLRGGIQGWLRAGHAVGSVLN